MKKRWALCLALLCALACACTSEALGEDTSVILRHEEMILTLDTGSGLSLVQVKDAKTGHEYFARPQPLFTWAICDDLNRGGWGWNREGDSSGMEVTDCQVTGDTEAVITLENRKDMFSAKVHLSLQDGAARITMTLRNHMPQRRYFSVHLPQLEYVSVPGKNPMAMVVQENGWTGKYARGNSYGMLPAGDSRLPTGCNLLQVAAVYSQEKEGGIFLCDLNGSLDGDILPAHMLISDHVVQSMWADALEADAECTLPTVALGVLRENDWHGAVDYYLANAGSIPQPRDVPEWLRKEAAIYSYPVGGAGACNLMVSGNETIQLKTFKEMDILLDAAREYGSSTVLMVHYYQRASLSREEIDSLTGSGPKTHYWNKGDYIIRQDLGGESAFKKGVEKIHENGGHVLVYVEPFIILEYAQVARENGARWAARRPDGNLDRSYVYNYTMSPNNPEWRKHLIEVCVRMVRDYGVDGIFLDSLGWQWNRIFYTDVDGVIYTPDEYNKALLSLVDEIRTAIRLENPEAVVMSECMGHALANHLDAAWTADYNDFAKHTSSAALTQSPGRYALNSLKLFGGGATIGQMRHIFAAGSSLALSSPWKNELIVWDELRTLTEIRTTYADALMWGKQQNWPAAKNEKVAVYAYEGEENLIVTACNTWMYAHKDGILLGEEQAMSRWEELQTHDVFTADADGKLNVALESGQLLVLRKID